MTMTRAKTSLLDDVPAARGRRRLCDAGRQAASGAITAVATGPDHGCHDHARDLLLPPARAIVAPMEVPATPTTAASAGPAPQPICPLCRTGTLTVIALLRPLRTVPP